MWFFEQSSGSLISPTGGVFAVGYSGAMGYKNNPIYQDVKDKGPIPIGLYAVESPRDTEKHGPYALPLVPNEGNDMFDRNAFLIHGDSVSNPGHASEGCVIMPRFARERIWESGDHELNVVAKMATKV